HDLHSLFCSLHSAAPTDLYPLSLHDALPISSACPDPEPSKTSKPTVIGVPAMVIDSDDEITSCRGNANGSVWRSVSCNAARRDRSEEHTSELQSRFDLVCRLLLEKKK